VSKTPGRTQRLHFFAERAASLAIVDLPGYGFARVSKQDRARFAVAVERYLRERTVLCGLILILDVRRAPQEDEEMLAEFAASRGIGLVCVATKVDKLGHGERTRRLRELERGPLGPWLPFSAVSREGRDALAQAIVLLARGQMEKAGKV
jgi:GTP-binding protein